MAVWVRFGFQLDSLEKKCLVYRRNTCRLDAFDQSTITTGPPNFWPKSLFFLGGWGCRSSIHLTVLEGTLLCQLAVVELGSKLNHFSSKVLSKQVVFSVARNEFRCDIFIIEYWVSQMWFCNINYTFSTLPEALFFYWTEFNTKYQTINFWCLWPSAAANLLFHHYKVSPVRWDTYFLVNRVENQKLNQTTAELPFGWLFGFQLGLRQTK